MSRIPLSPAATPVDIYTAPEVRLRLHGNELLQTAAALSEFNQELRPFLHQRAADFAREYGLQAEKDVRTRQIENQQQLKSAVDRGDLPESSNPWYMTALKQSVARIEMRRAAEGLQTEYENSDLRFKDNVGAVEQWASQRLSGLLEGRDQWEVEAMLPEMEQHVQALARQHSETRTREREAERASSTVTTLRSEMAGYDPFTLNAPVADTQSNYDSLAKTLNDRLDETKATVHPLKAAKWAVQSVLDEAEVRKDESFARELLKRMKDPVTGDPLSSIGWVKTDLVETERKISAQRFYDMQHAWETQRIEDQQSTQSLVAQIMPQALQGKPASEWTVDYTNTSPEAWLNFQSVLHSLKTQAASAKTESEQAEVQDLIAKFTKYTTDGGADPKRIQNYLIALSVHQGGLSSLKTAFDVLQDYQSNNWGTSSPEYVLGLQQKLADNSLTFTDVAEGVTNRQLSRRDADEWFKNLSVMLKGDEAQKSRAQRVKLAQDQLDVSFHSSYEQQQADFFQVPESGFLGLAQVQYNARLAQAKVVLADRIETLFENNPKLTIRQASAEIAKIRDELAAEYGVMPYGEASAYSIKANHKELTPTPKPTPAPKK